MIGQIKISGGQRGWAPRGACCRWGADAGRRGQEVCGFFGASRYKLRAGLSSSLKLATGTAARLVPNLKEFSLMETKRSLSILAALLAFGVGAPAAALAADGGGGASGSTPSAPVTAPGDVNQSTADEQQTGEQGDVANADLAAQVEQVDGANGNAGVNEEGQVGDGSDGQIDNGPAGNVGD